MPRLVLASQSPRRRELLGSLGLRFEVAPVDVDETPQPGEVPEVYVERLAREKALACAAVRRPVAGELVLAADTIVVLDDELLGKPGDATEARRMLGALAGRAHRVLTGVALAEPSSDRIVSSVEESEVWIGRMEASEIDWYVGTGEPLDKAGSYAIQGLGSLLVERIAGNYTNVVGLPLPATRRLFGELAYELLDFR